MGSNTNARCERDNNADIVKTIFLAFWNVQPCTVACDYMITCKGRNGICLFVYLFIMLN